MMELCPSLGLENGHDKATKKSPFGPYGRLLVDSKALVLMIRTFIWQLCC